MEENDIKGEGEEPEYFAEEDPFAIYPPPHQENKESSSSCLFCGVLNNNVPFSCSNNKGRTKRNRNEGVVKSLCKFLGVEDESECFSSASYCPSCEEDVRNIWRTLTKLKELQRELEGMKEEIKRKISLVVQSDGDEGAEFWRIRAKVALSLGLQIPVKMEVTTDLSSVHPDEDESQPQSGGERGVSSAGFVDDEDDSQSESYQYDSDTADCHYSEDNCSIMEDDNIECSNPNDTVDVDTIPQKTKTTSPTNSTLRHQYSLRVRTSHKKLIEGDDETDLHDEQKPGEAGKFLDIPNQDQGSPRKNVNDIGSELELDSEETSRTKKRGSRKRKPKERNLMSLRSLNEQCSICPKKFCSQVNLRAHVLKVHEGCETPYHCEHPGCTKQYRFSCDLVSHQRMRHNPDKRPNRTYQCSYCDKIFKRLSGLKDHQNRYHIEGGKKHQCSHCGMMFLSRNELKTHERIHTGNFPVKCEYCGKGFSHKSHLETHLNSVHHRAKPFECLTCQKSFLTKLTLQNHEVVFHSKGEVNFQCEICGKKFVTNHRLKLHKLMHIPEEEKFICQHCNKRFLRKCLLLSHIKLHEAPGQWNCEQCGDKFNTKQNLKRHIGRMHKEKG